MHEREVKQTIDKKCEIDLSKKPVSVNYISIWHKPDLIICGMIVNMVSGVKSNII